MAKAMRAVRRRLHHPHALRGGRCSQAIDEAIRDRTRGRRAGRDLPPQGGRPAQLAQEPASRSPRSTRRARAGQDVQATCTPYVAGGTGLSACLPPWASADGKLFEQPQGPRDAREDPRRDGPAARPSGRTSASSRPRAASWSSASTKPENKQYAGKRLGEIAHAMNKDWEEAVMDLLISEEQRHRHGVLHDERGQRQDCKLRQPWMKFGTDAGGERSRTARAGLTHPRSYGNYPRILGKYVRDEKVMPLEDAMRKMSSAVATRLSIADRGVLKTGCGPTSWCSIRRRSPTRRRSRSRTSSRSGMQYVFVNGVAVVEGRTAHRGEAWADRAGAGVQENSN